MNIAVALSELIEKSSWNKSRLAKRLNIKYQSLYDRLNPKKSMRVDNAVEMLDALNYDLVIVPKESNLPRGSIVVTVDSAVAEEWGE